MTDKRRVKVSSYDIAYQSDFLIFRIADKKHWKYYFVSFETVKLFTVYEYLNCYYYISVSKILV